MKKFIALATLLFEMETEQIANSPQFYFDFSWYQKYGKSSLQFADKFVSKEEDIAQLARMIKSDFDRGEWTAEKDGLYNYLMPEFYGGFISRKLEIQLADFTKIGIQTEMFSA
jgi:hypothetical protein